MLSTGASFLPDFQSCPQDEGFPIFLSDSIPESYYSLPTAEIWRRGDEAKKILGDSVFVLCHHYQRDETFYFHDAAGDSLNLSQVAAKQSARYIVFCGVHFMAESADILTSDAQTVMLPNLTAGCSMADMADLQSVEDCWEILEEIEGGSSSFIPITYINSSAALKAFCGRHGGVVCTSSNADRILKWAFDQNRPVFFFPDQHLGRNTAHQLGVPPESVLLWNRHHESGGLTSEQILQSKVLLWNGFCSVHARFTVKQVEAVRARHPGIQVIVHPECSQEVMAVADFSGSTNKIIEVIEASPAGSAWAVGTEINLVHRLRQRLRKRSIHIECLETNVCPCSTMYRTHPANVLWVLENLVQGRIINQIQVPLSIAADARIALNRMLSLS